MKYEDFDHLKIQNDISKIVRSVIIDFQKIDAVVLTSGDGSLLANYWDEIYVQMQTEAYSNWTLYT
jgi:hypothetical protein